MELFGGLLLVLLASLRLAASLPNMEDNLLPSDAEMLAEMLDRERARQQGQPEVEASLGLPSDAESFNTLNALFAGYGGVAAAMGKGGSGTQHFVSSSFPEVDARGFHEAVFDDFGDFYPRWRRSKRDPFGINSRGFHDDVFHQESGRFHPMKRAYSRWTPLADGEDANGAGEQRFSRSKRAVGRQDAVEEAPPAGKAVAATSTQTAPSSRRPGGDAQSQLMAKIHAVLGKMEHKRKAEMGSSGFHGDTFSGGFGDFDVMKRRPGEAASGFHGDTFSGGFGDFDVMRKRRPGEASSGFHGDTFSGGFGDFDVMKKRRPGEGSSGFHGDTFSGGFGDFDVMKKRRPWEASSGFHGDTFSGGFGDFDVMKKRRPGEASSGFHGDTFSGGFGDFDVMKKRRPGEGSSGFHGDTFSGGFGDFDVMKKRRPGEASSGFHGDTFSGGFGDFDVMKKAKPEMSESGFHKDAFKSGFGDFTPMKKRSPISRSASSGRSAERAAGAN